MLTRRESWRIFVASEQPRVRRASDAVVAVVSLAWLAVLGLLSIPSPQAEKSLAEVLSLPPGWFDFLWRLLIIGLMIWPAVIALACAATRRWAELRDVVLAALLGSAAGLVSNRVVSGSWDSGLVLFGADPVRSYPVVVVGLAFFRRSVLAQEGPAPAARPAPPARALAVAEPGAESPLAPRPFARPVAPVAPPAVYTSPVDFDSVNASVDQMSVDMNTIAGSTDKMRVAIDSIGHALQGMLYSLNEMAQDTAEGHKIVRNANNAASFTAATAADLAESARGMADVVSRVTQLARKTKDVAAQIDTEAVHTGTTGEAFTSVVAGEVKDRKSVV